VYVAFLANSAVFLMNGLDIDLSAQAGSFGPILWAIAAVLVSRSVGVFLLSRLGQGKPERWRPGPPSSTCAACIKTG